jgi:type IV pilus assembly protein PilM
MAENQAVWGIEIGQAGLKAIKLRYAEAAHQVLAVAFDYVPHPKLLSQPDAVPDELIRQALDTFIGRNKLEGDLIAMSLPGQTALAKFIQLPPVEESRVAEIIKYEAKQQIPFALEDVIWDYQPLGGGAAESGFLLDAEVGLFAMKKEQVHHHMKPFLDRKIEVELVQIAPLGTFNFLCYDRLGIRNDAPRPEIEDYTVVLDMGADNTTLLVTNGKKIWIRNVPIGGNHFTRALTKEMKLTFAKAEHLKCNATKSPDPRAVFQALRPVFNDYVAEIQRSIGFFANVNRNAKIGRLIGVGNGFKLAGLQKFLQQNLQYEVERVDHFQGVVGDVVLTAPLFQDNLLTFIVPYGLALQGLGLTDIHTTLLPREIALARKIRRKKPWAAATAASLLIGMAASTAGYGNVWHSVSTARFGEAEAKADKLSKDVTALQGKYNDETGRNSGTKAAGDKLVATLPTRELWLEVYKAIDECLPRDIGEQKDQTDIQKLNRISLEGVSCKKYDDLSTWYSAFSTDQKADMRKEDAETGPTGIGYIFTLNGHHYHNDLADPIKGQGQNYVNATLLENLKQDQVEVKDPLNGTVIGKVDVRRMGITHPISVWGPPSMEVQFYPHGRPGSRRTVAGGGGFGQNGALGGGLSDGAFTPGASSGAGFPGGQPRSPLILDDDKTGSRPISIKLTRFRIEFAWKPTPVAARVSLVAPDAADPNAAPTDANASPATPETTPPAS